MSYALITGASRGIGKAIAEELASRKVNLLLVARSGEELKVLAESLALTYAIQADWRVADLTDPNAPADIFKWVNDREYPVSILVNNAGYGLSGHFEKFNPEEHTNLMQVNMHAPVILCNLFLPLLKKSPEAHILNIVSSAAYQAVPGLGVYGASKAFLLSFSRALSYELKKSTVSVTAVSPGSTDTAFADRAKVGTKALKAAEKVNMTANEVAKIAVDAMYERKTEVITGLINKVGAFLVWLLPKKFVENAAASLYELD